MTAENNMDIPKFLTDPVTGLSKPDVEIMHHDKMVEIFSHMDKEDAELACEQLAKKYPVMMLGTVAKEINASRDALKEINSIVKTYIGEEETDD